MDLNLCPAKAHIINIKKMEELSLFRTRKKTSRLALREVFIKWLAGYKDKKHAKLHCSYS